MKKKMKIGIAGIVGTKTTNAKNQIVQPVLFGNMGSGHPLTKIPWHSVETRLMPYQRAVRELHLLAHIIERDWTQDATTSEQDRELILISRSLKRISARLTMVFEQEKET
jgi:hypothetical protein